MSESKDPNELPGESALYQRILEYGTRGIVEIESAEGSPVSPEAVHFLVPAN